MINEINHLSTQEKIQKQTKRNNALTTQNKCVNSKTKCVEFQQVHTHKLNKVSYKNKHSNNRVAFV